MRTRDAIRLILVLASVLLMWLIANMPINIQLKIKDTKDILGLLKPTPAHVVTPANKCGLSKECPADHFPFRIKSGAANVIGPKICFDGKIVMSNALNNVGSGLNILLVNGQTGEIIKAESFNMYAGDVKGLLEFLKAIKPGTIIIVASYDEPATNMNDEIREIFTRFGSSMIKSVQYRDNWLFIGAEGIEEKSPFEKHLKNAQDTNIYDGWPEMIEMDGCFPKKI
ncbi:protein FAM3D isoform X2 [Lepisosteus oculatus]|uniref:protein FAM3D isoform X2 n=1 Tax=Lepisosteus oculatus TaxID=7918 RepID=UPI00074003CE|nr:PREDICTED: protein FAM3D isoform X2 [Lepisosteus oculatus]